MRRIGLVLALLATGCLSPLTGEPAYVVLEGQVDFGSPMTTQATIGEIATAATVSLIETSTNKTVQTALTDATGKFILAFGNRWRPSSTETYYIEAIKGLGNNQASMPVARVRTIARYQNGGWTSITNGTPGGITVTRTTSALSVIASLQGGASVPPAGLIGKLALSIPDASIAPTTPDTFADAGTGISNAQFHHVFGLVDKSIAENRDPVDSIVKTGSTFGMKAPSGAGGAVLLPPGLYTVFPASGKIGTQVTLYGDNFLTEAASNSVSFNGTNAVPMSATSKQLVVVVPVGATSGEITVSTPAGTIGGASFTVDTPMTTDISGNLNPR